MTRGPEIAVLVDDLWESLGKKKQADGEAPCLSRRIFDFLRSLPDYTEHLRATIPDDFAQLPAEIIHDVVDADECVLGMSLNCLVDVEGFWGEFARKRIEKPKSSVWIAFVGSTFLKRLADREYQPVTFEEVQDHSIHCAEIDERSDFDQLSAVAPNLYESIEFTNVPHIPGDIITRLGNRFSSVKWLIGANTSNEGKPTENYTKPEVADFLKRQLQSKYLRELQIAALGFEQGELDDLLVDFVKRPHFEGLDLSESVLQNCYRNPGGYALSFDVIKEAHNAWNSRILFEVRSQNIRGSISKETREQLKEYFKTYFEGQSHKVHHNSPPVEMELIEVTEQLEFHMRFCQKNQI